MQPRHKKYSLAFRAIAAHALGDIAAARADFAAATELEGQPLYSLRGSHHARHHLDLGDLAAARALADHGLDEARRTTGTTTFPRFHALLARIDLAEGLDPTPHLDEIRAWTSRTGEMEYIIEAHLLAARHLLARGDTQAALGEAETGLLHAVACGYGLLRIELLVALARIRLAWPDPPKAIQAAREALDLAAASRLPVRLGRGRRRPGLGRGVLRQPRARARAPRVHAGARGPQAHRAPGRR